MSVAGLRPAGSLHENINRFRQAEDGGVCGEPVGAQQAFVHQEALLEQIQLLNQKADAPVDYLHLQVSGLWNQRVEGILDGGIGERNQTLEVEPRHGVDAAAGEHAVVAAGNGVVGSPVVQHHAVVEEVGFGHLERGLHSVEGERAAGDLRIVAKSDVADGLQFAI